MTRIQEYEIYHERVTEYCVELMGEVSREFYEKYCAFFKEFEQGIHPRLVAQELLETMRDLLEDTNEHDQQVVEPIQDLLPGLNG